MAYDPREMLAAARYIAVPASERGHAPGVLKALDEYPCEDCGRPVGREARCSSQCMACLTVDLVAGGMPSEEIAGILSRHAEGVARG